MEQGERQQGKSIKLEQKRRTIEDAASLVRRALARVVAHRVQRDDVAVGDGVAARRRRLAAIQIVAIAVVIGDRALRREHIVALQDVAGEVRARVRRHMRPILRAAVVAARAAVERVACDVAGASVMDVIKAAAAIT
jgi:hypothetical protein